jgi:hypothetical protein
VRRVHQDVIRETGGLRATICALNERELKAVKTLGRATGTRSLRLSARAGLWCPLPARRKATKPLRGRHILGASFIDRPHTLTPI